jgi:predicted RNA-binding Zn ribbon-like protein
MEASSSSDRPEGLHFPSGHPALDFVNSVNPRAGPEARIDYLGDYEQTAHWAWHASVISEAERDELLGLAAVSPGGADAVWRRTTRLREALFRVFRALTRGEGPVSDDLALIDEERHRADRETVLVARNRDGDDSSPAVEIVLGESAALEAPLWSLARSAAELLTEVDPTRLRECPAEAGGCGWIVLDETRNRSRRWCDMRVCGNRAKAARLTERRREARARTPGTRSVRSQ